MSKSIINTMGGDNTETKKERIIPIRILKSPHVIQEEVEEEEHRPDNSKRHSLSVELDDGTLTETLGTSIQLGSSEVDEEIHSSTTRTEHVVIEEIGLDTLRRQTRGEGVRLVPISLPNGQVIERNSEENKQMEDELNIKSVPITVSQKKSPSKHPPLLPGFEDLSNWGSLPPASEVLPGNGDEKVIPIVLEKSQRVSSKRQEFQTKMYSVEEVEEPKHSLESGSKPVVQESIIKNPSSESQTYSVEEPASRKLSQESQSKTYSVVQEPILRKHSMESQAYSVEEPVSRKHSQESHSKSVAQESILKRPSSESHTNSVGEPVSRKHSQESQRKNNSVQEPILKKSSMESQNYSVEESARRKHEEESHTKTYSVVQEPIPKNFSQESQRYFVEEPVSKKYSQELQSKTYSVVQEPILKKSSIESQTYSVEEPISRKHSQESQSKPHPTQEPYTKSFPEELLSKTHSIQEESSKTITQESQAKTYTVQDPPVGFKRVPEESQSKPYSVTEPPIVKTLSKESQIQSKSKTYTFQEPVIVKKDFVHEPIQTNSSKKLSRDEPKVQDPRSVKRYSQEVVLVAEESPTAKTTNKVDKKPTVRFNVDSKESTPSPHRRRMEEELDDFDDDNSTEKEIHKIDEDINKIWRELKDLENPRSSSSSVTSWPKTTNPPPRYPKPSPSHKVSIHESPKYTPIRDSSLTRPGVISKSVSPSNHTNPFGSTEEVVEESYYSVPRSAPASDSLPRKGSMTIVTSSYKPTPSFATPLTITKGGERLVGAKSEVKEDVKPSLQDPPPRINLQDKETQTLSRGDMMGKKENCFLM